MMLMPSVAVLTLMGHNQMSAAVDGARVVANR